MPLKGVSSVSGKGGEITGFFTKNLQEMISDLKQVIECESPSGNVRLLNSCADRISRIIESRTGIKPDFEDLADGSRVLTFSVGQGEGDGILVLSHYDTVFPEGTLEKRPFLVSEGKIQGPGVLDMKAGIIQGIWALKFLMEHARVTRRIKFLMTPDEETGSLHSRKLIEESGKTSTLAIVLESSENGKLKTGRKGVGTYKITVNGRSAHAGLHPEDGINAILEAAYLVLELQELQDTSRGTTINVGMISGGTTTNVVPDVAEIGVDVRVASMEESRRVDQSINALKPRNADARVTIAGGLNRMPMSKNERTESVLREVAKIGAGLGILVEDISVGGASDANILAQTGMAILDGMGSVGSGAHSNSEFVAASTIPLRTALLAITLLRYSELQGDA
jgi:glutamate carboxypeptidase